MIADYNLFLDDVRIPTHVTWVEIPKNQHYSVVRNYNEFVDLITLRGLPKFVCYDHDLADCHYGHGLNNDDIPFDAIIDQPHGAMITCSFLAVYIVRNSIII